MYKMIGWKVGVSPVAATNQTRSIVEFPPLIGAGAIPSARFAVADGLRREGFCTHRPACRRSGDAMSESLGSQTVARMPRILRASVRQALCHQPEP